MKKSTLITTIAMIVVVVVALSTATYAWFTSATQSTATDTISVTSTSGWMLAGTSEKTLSNGTDTVSFSFAQPIQLNLMDGLYSPTAEITSKISSAGDSATFANMSWFQATQTGIELASSVEITEGTDKVDIITANSSTANYIKVKNSKSADTGLRLSITVWTDATGEAQLAAAQKLCAYVAFHNGTNQYTANTAYYYGTVAAGTDPEDAAEKVTVTRSTNKVAASTTIDGAGDVYTKAIAGSNSWVNAGTTALPTALTGESSAIDTGKYYTYTLDFGTIAVNGEVNIALYVWFDGWEIFSTANGAGATVYLAFGDATV